MSIGPSEFGGYAGLDQSESEGAVRNTGDWLSMMHLTDPMDETSGAEIPSDRVV